MMKFPSPSITAMIILSAFLSGCASMGKFSETVPYIPPDEVASLKVLDKVSDIITKYGDPYFSIDPHAIGEIVMYYPVSPVSRMMMYSSNVGCSQITIRKENDTWTVFHVDGTAGPCADNLKSYNKSQIVNIRDYLTVKKKVARGPRKQTRAPASNTP